MEFRGFMGGLYRITEWIMRLSVTNILWVLCSFPVFLLFFTILLTPAEEFTKVFFGLIGFIAILAPFVLFPATAAMFALARKWVTGDEDVPILKTYFRAYKENYVQSMIGGILFILLIVTIVVNYRFYAQQEGLLRGFTLFFIVLGAFNIATIANYFSIMVHLHMKTLQLFKNAILLSIANPLSTIFIISGNSVIVYFSLYRFTFLIPFFMGTLIATYSFWLFFRSYESIIAKQKQLEEKRKQQEEEQASTEDQSTSS